jgi:hypothetical protein
VYINNTANNSEPFIKPPTTLSGHLMTSGLYVHKPKEPTLQGSASSFINNSKYKNLHNRTVHITPLQEFPKTQETEQTAAAIKNLLESFPLQSIDVTATHTERLDLNNPKTPIADSFCKVPQTLDDFERYNLSTSKRLNTANIFNYKPHPDFKGGDSVWSL